MNYENIRKRKLATQHGGVFMLGGDVKWVVGDSEKGERGKGGKAGKWEEEEGKGCGWEENKRVVNEGW